MELRHEHGGIIIENKVFTALDKFVADFTKVLEEYIDYGGSKWVCCNSFWKGTWH